MDTNSVGVKAVIGSKEVGSRAAWKMGISLLLILVMAIGFGLGGLDWAPVLFAGAFGGMQLLALWVMVEMSCWQWPSKRAEKTALTVMALGILVMSGTLGCMLWVER